MTTITLPPDVERPLVDEAHRRGTTPERLAVDCLRQAFSSTRADSSPQGGSLFEWLAPFAGKVEGTGENLSEGCGSRLTDILVERQSGSGE